MPEHRIETHAHTNVVSPCGRLSPRQLVDAYLAAGYSGLIITDHLVWSLPIFFLVRSWPKRVRKYFAGFRAVREAARGTGLQVYPGMELSFRDAPGHDFLVYGIHEAMLSRMPDICRMDPATFKPLAESAGAIVFQAHPFRGDGPYDTSIIDGLEVYNGNPRHNSKNERAACFARDHGLLSISGSDAHQAEDVARGGITVPEVPATITELVSWYHTAPDTIGLLGDSMHNVGERYP